MALVERNVSLIGVKGRFKVNVAVQKNENDFEQPVLVGGRYELQSGGVGAVVFAVVFQV